MKYIQHLLHGAKRIKHVSPLLLLSGVFLIASIACACYPQNNSATVKPRVKGIAHSVSPAFPTTAQTPTASTSITNAPRKTVPFSSPVPTSTIFANQSTTQSPASPLQNAAAQTSSPTTIPTNAPQSSVTIQISEPDGTFNFTVKLMNGDNLCDNLTEAKNEGKIKSVTLDNSYMSTFHSAYVREINGYQNNWTFSVNGKSPHGCSLYTPNAGDSITWKFG